MKGKEDVRARGIFVRPGFFLSNRVGFYFLALTNQGSMDGNGWKNLVDRWINLPIIRDRFNTPTRQGSNRTVP